MGKRTCSVEGCQSIVKARGWCWAHYLRWRRTGDPLGSTRQRPGLWDRIDRSGGLDSCWPWTGPTDRDGYGTISGHWSNRAHRVVAALAFGEDSVRGRTVCHACDNPPCCNPLHMFIGSVADNQRDMVEKGRSLKGERHPNAKLTEDNVRAIRADGRKQREIAADYGIKQAAVSEIKRGATWTHVA